MLKPGISFTSRTEVTASETARSLGSGDMDVLATPAMAALMENAAMKCAAPHLEAGQTTVGSLIRVTHLRPTLPGDTVSATATLTAAEGRKLSFAVEARDSKGEIGRGEHIRYIVDRARFLAKAKEE